MSHTPNASGPGLVRPWRTVVHLPAKHSEIRHNRRLRPVLHIHRCMRNLSRRPNFVRGTWDLPSNFSERHSGTCYVSLLCIQIPHKQQVIELVADRTFLSTTPPFSSPCENNLAVAVIYCAQGISQMASRLIALPISPMVTAVSMRSPPTEPLFCRLRGCSLSPVILDSLSREPKDPA